VADLFSNVGTQGTQATANVQTFNPSERVEERAVRQQRVQSGDLAENESQSTERVSEPVSAEALQALGLESTENNPNARRGSFVDIVA